MKDNSKVDLKAVSKWIVICVKEILGQYVSDLDVGVILIRLDSLEKTVI